MLNAGQRQKLLRALKVQVPFFTFLVVVVFPCFFYVRDVSSGCNAQYEVPASEVSYILEAPNTPEGSYVGRLPFQDYLIGCMVFIGW